MASVPELASLSAVLVLYNGLITLVPGGFHDRHYVPVNLAFLGLLLLWANLGFHLSPAELGWSWPQSGISALWGIAVGSIIVGPLFATAILPLRAREQLKDPRISSVTGRWLAYRALVRIPLGTALFEETAFRCILFGALLEFGPWHAIWASSLVVGLWHIRPTLDLARRRRVKTTDLLAVSVLGGLLATTAGGVLFGLMRHYTGSMARPVVAHGLINSLALVAAYLNRNRSSHTVPNSRQVG